MGFVAPLFAFFAVLAAVPIAIHLWGRPRAERRRFAALAFLLTSERKTSRHRRLRQILLLVARAMAIALVPLVLARPWVEAASVEPTGIGSGRAESAVIVIDDSRSMGAQRGAGTLFDEARRRAQKLVDGLGRDSEAAIVAVATSENGFSGGTPERGPAGDGFSKGSSELSVDRARLRRQLAELRPTHRAGDVTGALRRAAAILAAATRGERRVYLFSDMAAHGFSSEPPWPPGGPTLMAVDVTDGEPIDNRAVIDLRVESAPELGPHGVRVDATVANFGHEPVKDLPITLRVDGRSVAKGLLEIPPGGRTVKRFFHTLEDARPAGTPAPSGESTHDVAVELAGDALPDDDRRFARVEMRREVKALLVDGDPRTIRRDDEVFYLETALRPGDRDDSRIETTVTTLDDLGRRRLDDFDVVFLANAKAPDAARAAALAAWVDKGGGLFISVGDNVDPEAWNSALGDLLPQPLATARTVCATSKSRADGETEIGGAGDHVARFDRRHPLLAPFSPSAAGAHGHGPADALREARVCRYLLLKPTPREADREVLLHLESGAPLLVEGRHGAGRVLLLASTVDRDWSDLAIQPAFLPLMQQAARYLARAALREPDAPSLVGQPHDIPLAEGDQRAEVTTPAGALRHFDAERVVGRKALAFTDTDEPGVYKVAAGGAGGVPRPRPQVAFAVNVDGSESDPARIEPARLAELSHARPGDAQPRRRRIELWHAMGAALLGLLLIEGLLATRRV